MASEIAHKLSSESNVESGRRFTKMILELSQDIQNATLLTPASLATLEENNLSVLLKFGEKYTPKVLVKIALWSKGAIHILENNDKLHIADKIFSTHKPTRVQVEKLQKMAERFKKEKEMADLVIEEPVESPANFDLQIDEPVEYLDRGGAADKKEEIVGTDTTEKLMEREWEHSPDNSWGDDEERRSKFDAPAGDGKDIVFEKPVEAVADFDLKLERPVLYRPDAQKESADFKQRLDKIRTEKKSAVVREREELVVKKKSRIEKKRETVQYLKDTYGELPATDSIKKALNLLFGIENIVARGTSPLTGASLTDAEKLGFADYVAGLARQAAKHKEYLTIKNGPIIAEAEKYTKGLLGKARGFFYSSKKISSEEKLKEVRGTLESWDGVVKKAKELADNIKKGNPLNEHPGIR
jgi:hypothetical protein